MTLMGEVRRIAFYDAWANRRILDAMLALDSEQLSGTMGTEVLATLRHILTSQWFLLGLAGHPSTGEEDLQTPASIASAFASTQRRFAELLDFGLADWDHTASGRESVSTGTVLIQMLCHGIQHRAEAGLLLSALGQNPGDLDFLTFAMSAERRSGTG